MLFAPFANEGLEIQQLLAQREQLFGELRDEELREANEVAQARRRVAAAEVEERERRQASFDEHALCKQAEERLARAEGGTAATAMHAFSQGFGLRPEVLMAEVQATKQQLQSARTARVALATARAASERQKLDEWVDAIRTSSQENQSLQANQQMALAHLKALEAMAASSAAQASGREEALYGLLRNLEEHESAAFDLQQRAEVAESRLGVSTMELRRHEAATAPAGRVSAQLSEHEELHLERARLHAEAHRLELEVGAAQDQLDNGRRSLGPDEVLRTNLADLSTACEVATQNVNALSCRPPLLEAEVARLMTELLEERRVVVELEELKDTYGGAATKLRGRVDSEVLEIESQLLAEGMGSRELVQRFTEEEEALASELEAAEKNTKQLRTEAAEREDQFRKITRDLQDQIDSLRKEEVMEAQAPSPAWAAVPPTVQTPSPAWAAVPPTAQTPGVMPVSASAPFLGAIGTANSSTSRPPGPLVDPGKGAEPPPRRGGVQTPRQSEQALVDDPSTTVAGLKGTVANGSSANVFGSTMLASSASTPALHTASSMIGREPSVSAFQAPQPLVQPTQDRLTQRSLTPIQQLQERLLQRRAELVAQQQESGQHPYWLERSRYPMGAPGVSPRLLNREVLRTASHSPSQHMNPLLMRQADPGASQLPAYSPIGRRELSATTSTVVPGSSNSILFRTYNGSTETTPFRTPPAGRPERASPLATTQRRGAGDALLSEAPPMSLEAAARGVMLLEAPPMSLEAAARGGTPRGRARTPRESAPPFHQLPSVAWQQTSALPGVQMPPQPPQAHHDTGDVAAGGPVTNSGMNGKAAGGVTSGNFGPERIHQSSPPPRSLTMNTIRQAETEVLGLAAHLADAQERRAAFQARISELKGVIGASLQSLDEEEAADTRSVSWSSISRAQAFAEREAALRPGGW